jgi:TatD DNase family protein
VIKDMLALEQRYKGACFAMTGLHPCSVKENVNEELTHVHNWLIKRRFAAVGEIGLDFYHDTTFKEQQYHAFHQQIQWALEFDHPIVIHSRNAMRETIDVIKQYPLLRGIFHCFSGNEADAREIIATGFYLGIGGVLTYKNAGLDKAIQNIDLEHLVLETDAPYLTPVPHRGKRNESSYLTYIIDKLAEIKGVTKEEVAVITTANAQKIFGN